MKIALIFLAFSEKLNFTTWWMIDDCIIFLWPVNYSKLDYKTKRLSQFFYKKQQYYCDQLIFRSLTNIFSLLIFRSAAKQKFVSTRDVTTGATGATSVAPKFSDTLTLSPPGGQILPTIAEVASKFSLQLRPCLLNPCRSWTKMEESRLWGS